MTDYLEEKTSIHVWNWKRAVIAIFCFFFYSFFSFITSRHISMEYQGRKLHQITTRCFLARQMRKTRKKSKTNISGIVRLGDAHGIGLDKFLFRRISIFPFFCDSYSMLLLFSIHCFRNNLFGKFSEFNFFVCLIIY